MAQQEKEGVDARQDASCNPSKFPLSYQINAKATSENTVANQKQGMWPAESRHPPKGERPGSRDPPYGISEEWQTDFAD